MVLPVSRLVHFRNLEMPTPVIGKPGGFVPKNLSIRFDQHGCDQ